MSQIFPQMGKPLILRSETSLSGLAADRRSKNSCANWNVGQGSECHETRNGESICDQRAGWAIVALG
jgi:hypothetical protein